MDSFGQDSLSSVKSVLLYLTCGFDSVVTVTSQNLNNHSSSNEHTSTTQNVTPKKGQVNLSCPQKMSYYLLCSHSAGNYCSLINCNRYLCELCAAIIVMSI
jgi:hypothetical protein